MDNKSELAYAFSITLSNDDHTRFSRKEARERIDSILQRVLIGAEELAYYEDVFNVYVCEDYIERISISGKRTYKKQPEATSADQDTRWNLKIKFEGDSVLVMTLASVLAKNIKYVFYNEYVNPRYYDPSDYFII